jgi:hypothetical protein
LAARQLPAARMNLPDRVALRRMPRQARTARADRVPGGQGPAVAGPAPGGRPDPVRLRLRRTGQVSGAARWQRASRRRRALRQLPISPMDGHTSAAITKLPLWWVPLRRTQSRRTQSRRTQPRSTPPGRPTLTESAWRTRPAARLTTLPAGPRGLGRVATADPARKSLGRKSLGRMSSAGMRSARRRSARTLRAPSAPTQTPRARKPRARKARSRKPRSRPGRRTSRLGRARNCAAPASGCDGAQSDRLDSRRI